VYKPQRTLRTQRSQMARFYVKTCMVSLVCLVFLVWFNYTSFNQPPTDKLSRKETQNSGLKTQNSSAFLLCLVFLVWFNLRPCMNRCLQRFRLQTAPSAFAVVSAFHQRSAPKNLASVKIRLIRVPAFPLSSPRFLLPCQPLLSMRPLKIENNIRLVRVIVIVISR
jgi:hypothetical protein